MRHTIARASVDAAWSNAIDVMTRIGPGLYDLPQHQRRAALEAAAGMITALRAAGVLRPEREVCNCVTGLISDGQAHAEACPAPASVQDSLFDPMDPKDVETLDAYELGEDRP